MTGPGKVDSIFNDVSVAEPEFVRCLSVFTQCVNGSRCIGNDDRRYVLGSSPTVHSVTIMPHAMQGVWTRLRTATTIHTPPTYRTIYANYHHLELYHDPLVNPQDFGKTVAKEGKSSLSSA